MAINRETEMWECTHRLCKKCDRQGKRIKFKTRSGVLRHMKQRMYHPCSFGVDGVLTCSACKKLAGKMKGDALFSGEGRYECRHKNCNKTYAQSSSRWRHESDTPHNCGPGCEQCMMLSQRPPSRNLLPKKKKRKRADMGTPTSMLDEATPPSVAPPQEDGLSHLGGVSTEPDPRELELVGQMAPEVQSFSETLYRHMNTGGTFTISTLSKLYETLESGNANVFVFWEEANPFRDIGVEGGLPGVPRDSSFYAANFTSLHNFSSGIPPEEQDVSLDAPIPSAPSSRVNLPTSVIDNSGATVSTPHHAPPTGFPSYIDGVVPPLPYAIHSMPPNMLARLPGLPSGLEGTVSSAGGLLGEPGLGLGHMPTFSSLQGLTDDASPSLGDVETVVEQGTAVQRPPPHVVGLPPFPQ